MCRCDGRGKGEKVGAYAFIKKNDLYFQDKIRTTDNILKKKGNDGKPYLFAARIPNTKENPSKIPGLINQISKTICLREDCWDNLYLSKEVHAIVLLTIGGVKMTKLTVNVDFIINQFIYQLIEEEDRKLPIYKKIKFNLLEEKVCDNDTDEYFCTKEETTEEKVPEEDDLNLIYLISDLKKRSLFLLFSCTYFSLVVC